MSRSKSSPRRDRIDPVVRHARREAWVILAAFAVFLIWSVSYCYLAGYPDSAEQSPAQVLGMPSWVFWGVVLPWMVADVFALWFCFFFMADDSLNHAAGEDEWLTGQTPEGVTGREAPHA